VSRRKCDELFWQSAEEHIGMNEQRFDTLLCELASLWDTLPETIRELAAHWYALVFPTGSRQYQYDIERVSLCVTNYWPA
jgi:hypothetical protein